MCLTSIFRKVLNTNRRILDGVLAEIKMGDSSNKIQNVIQAISFRVQEASVLWLATKHLVDSTGF
jgi:hypothetical protein